MRQTWIGLFLLTLTAWADPAPTLFVEGYFDQLSYLPGEEVRLHASTSADKFSITIARFGAETKEVYAKTGLAGKESPIPEHASSQGCNWPVLHSLVIPKDWPTGYYAVTLRVTDAGGKFTHRSRRSAEASLFFVVRDPAPGQRSRILLQLATNTYNAYNNWGGSSLYAYHGRGNLQGHRVSFNRPLTGQLFDRWEAPFIRWAEKAGYKLDIACNSDLELRPEILAGYKLVLSVGHDEYWSTPMRDQLESFIAKGGNVAFFSGNTCCWQVRTEDVGRSLTCWKQWFNNDPIFKTGDHKTLSTLWGHHLLQRPENQLTGVGFLHGGYHKSHGQYMDGSGAYTVHRPDHWLFAGTKLQQGAEFGGPDTIVGYECDGCEMTWKEGLPFPTGADGTPANFTILATAPARWHPDDAEWYERWVKNREGHAVIGLYTNTGTVVTVGSTDWAHGLVKPDPAVDRITRNVLDRLAK